MSDTVITNKKIRLIDLVIILLCVSCAVIFLYLFRLDFNKSFNSQKEAPVGTLVIRYNIVQRRSADRMLWDRMADDSPVYSEDLIRVAANSKATLFLDDHEIQLNEKTLIRVQRSSTAEDQYFVELREGSIGLTSGESGGITVNFLNQQLNTGPGTVFYIKSDKDGIVLQVAEGVVFITEGDNFLEIKEGAMYAIDSEGNELSIPGAVVTHPKLFAHFIKNNQNPVPISFAWNRINLEPEESLRLEISENSTFYTVDQTIQNLMDQALVSLDAGIWYWRLSSADAILNTGTITIADATGLSLNSPVTGSIIRYISDPPRIAFQWSEIENATAYYLEASLSPDFINPGIKKQTASNFYIDSRLQNGTWHWRVIPIFPSVYEGYASFSDTAHFSIEQGAVDELELPEPVVIVVEAAPVAPPPVARAPVRTAPTPAPRPAARPAPAATPIPAPAPIATPTPAPAQPSAPSLLSAPLNRRPVNGHRVDVQQLRNQRHIVFSWQEVQDANAYILTLYERSASGQRQIIQTAPMTATTWTLDNLSLLNQGSFVWTVEAVSRNQNNVITLRGVVEETIFIMDVPPTGRVTIDQPGVLYAD